VSASRSAARARSAVAATLLTVGALGCAQGEAAPTPGVTRHEIRMRSNSFAPRDLAVTLGDTVTWRNTDIVRHELRGGESYTWIPSDTGTYAYRCTIQHLRRRKRQMRPAGRSPLLVDV
jgi:plastocyanin